MKQPRQKDLGFHRHTSHLSRRQTNLDALVGAATEKLPSNLHSTERPVHLEPKTSLLQALLVPLQMYGAIAVCIWYVRFRILRIIQVANIGSVWLKRVKNNVVDRFYWDDELSGIQIDRYGDHGVQLDEATSHNDAELVKKMTRVADELVLMRRAIIENACCVIL